MPQEEGEVSGDFPAHWFEWHIFKTEMYSTHVWKVNNISVWVQYIFANICSLSFHSCSQFAEYFRRLVCPRSHALDGRGTLVLQGKYSWTVVHSSYQWVYHQRQWRGCSQITLGYLVVKDEGLLKVTGSHVHWKSEVIIFLKRC